MSIDRGYRAMSYLKLFCVVRGRGGIKGRLSIPYPFVYSLLMGNGGKGDPYQTIIGLCIGDA